jgi:phosphomannomutase
LLLTPSLQRYDWGHAVHLPELLGMPSDGRPLAEAWFGAHPAAPARARIGTLEQPLNQLITARPELLGADAQDRFGGLPYLLKLLAAAQPLSIQVHPGRAHAAAGFEAEERAGIARHAPERRYRDANHKPELLVALSEFHALCGFRSPEEIAAALRDELPEVGALLPRFEPDSQGLRALVSAYFALPEQRLVPELERWVARLSAEHERAPFGRETPAYWALRAHEARRGTADRGLVFVYLLEPVQLAPGQGLFLPPGVIHAYLEGAGIEVMAASDNVLRAGLTSKHVDTEELLQIVHFDARRPPVLEPVLDSHAAEFVYATPAQEFELSRLKLEVAGSWRGRTTGPETLLVLSKGEQSRVRVGTAAGELTLESGQACLIPDGANLAITSDGAGSPEVYRIKLPSETRAEQYRGRAPVRLAFGTSGLRGLVTDITDLEAYVNARGFLEFSMQSGGAVAGSSIPIAGDLRPSTNGPERSILRAVARAIRDTDMQVEHCGSLPTPALTYYGLHLGVPSIMVTGSHIPFDRNGIKFNKAHGEVLKSDEPEILRAVERVRRIEYGRPESASPFDDRGQFLPAVAAANTLPAVSGVARTLYVRRYLDAFSSRTLSGLRVALYEHSAVGRDVLAEILRGLGASVVPAGRSERFVAIDTEAMSATSIAELQQLADSLRAKVGALDAIVSTDGDSDRPLLLGLDPQQRVHFVSGDVLGVLVADYLGADAIAVPVSATDVIERHFAARGVLVRRTRIGSPYVLEALAAMPGERRVGFEANGGFLVGSRLVLEHGTLAPLPTRDAVLPLVCALHAARRAGSSVLELVAQLPQRHGRSALLDEVPPEASQRLLERFSSGRGELRSLEIGGGGVRAFDFTGEELALTAEEQRKIATIVRELGSVFNEARGFGPLVAVDNLDGLRLTFAGGDVAHVRASGNAPQLRFYALANDAERAELIIELALEQPGGILRELLRIAHELQ